jgi:hypothetical protein
MTRKQKRDLKNIVVNILSYITYAIMMLVIAGLAYLALDFLGLVAWAVSGQVPEGGFNTGYYIGRVSYIIISLIIK